MGEGGWSARKGAEEGSKIETERKRRGITPLSLFSGKLAVQNRR